MTKTKNQVKKSSMLSPTDFSDNRFDTFDLRISAEGTNNPFNGTIYARGNSDNKRMDTLDIHQGGVQKAFGTNQEDDLKPYQDQIYQMWGGDGNDVFYEGDAFNGSNSITIAKDFGNGNDKLSLISPVIGREYNAKTEGGYIKITDGTGENFIRDIKNDNKAWISEGKTYKDEDGNEKPITETVVNDWLDDAKKGYDAPIIFR